MIVFEHRLVVGGQYCVVIVVSWAQNFHGICVIGAGVYNPGFLLWGWLILF
jgi:hypothetical protein